MEFFMAILPFLVLILVMYFLMIRPAQKKQKNVQDMQANMQKGDEIITIGGLHGTVESFDQKHMYIRTDAAGSAVLKFERVALKEIVK
ncbi:preprotein translocase subunit YajC [Salinicoccus hispanicus]|uniref:Preprotein translocase subunit YajC n=1 Tax=Salinicoccus hispanicus TaxID=157225 RepID=A0A6N8TWF4_9STAP|nr:preprotein translocase subunit YajC [Salinicoccus hispanicus]MXQ50033.1 preprotein translocase subunit YajC [Salinicoccus hispanicus]